MLVDFCAIQFQLDSIWFHILSNLEMDQIQREMKFLFGWVYILYHKCCNNVTINCNIKYTIFILYNYIILEYIEDLG